MKWGSLLIGLGDGIMGEPDTSPSAHPVTIRELEERSTQRVLQHRNRITISISDYAIP